jgi:outer membrane protein assembly factor BamB
MNSATDAMDPASGENLRWVVKLGSETHGSPVIADGRVYVGSNFHASERFPAQRGAQLAGGRLLCLEERTGRLLWELLAPHLPETGASGDRRRQDGLRRSGRARVPRPGV